MPYNCNQCDKCMNCLGTPFPNDTYCARCDVYGHAEGSPTCSRMALSDTAVSTEKVGDEEQSLSKTIESLSRRVVYLESRDDELKTIKSTLMINFDDKRGVKYGLILKDEGSVSNMVFNTIKHLTGLIDKEEDKS